MLLKRRILDGIVDGTISLAFRRWKRPTVKTGGSLRTTVGVLAIEAVDQVDEKSITARQAKQAGSASLAELLAELNARTEGELYRIRLKFAGADPRLDLRQRKNLTEQELAVITTRLSKMDARSQRGSWTTQTLELIADNPCTLAADLAESVGQEKKPFKANVRKLKELGLTESLKVGYRLSRRGEVVLARIRLQANV